MSNAVLKTPADQAQRQQALDPTRSILVQAPAGSGKTTLLTERFLTLLGEVDEPGQVVAITFTNAAAAEMRNRVLDALRAAELGSGDVKPAVKTALDRAHARGWKLLDLPSQLRIGTIDAFCRELALQQPLLSGLGAGLTIAEQPDELYRRAARYTLEEIGRRSDATVSAAVEALLAWRDNNWQELEDLLMQMLANRARWMQDFVLNRSADWDALREQLERPFARAVRDELEAVSQLLNHVPAARAEALELARFACGQECGEQHRPLAELSDFPVAPFMTPEELEEAHQALLCLGNLVLTGGGDFRAQVDKRLGFPADRKAEKNRLLNLIADLRAVEGLEEALCALRTLPPARYAPEDWEIVKACFTLLRRAAAQLRVVFAEASAVDFIEVAQMAELVLKTQDGFPSDAALVVADSIQHLLVDEFQDTSRRQHQLLAGLIGAWPERAGRTLFAVGDPMQSIYFFRDADAELFGRVKELGLEVPNGEPLPLDFVQLTVNFRTEPTLVKRLNGVFAAIFAQEDGSGVRFAPANPALDAHKYGTADNFALHLKFIAQDTSNNKITSNNRTESEEGKAAQAAEIVQLIHTHSEGMRQAEAEGTKYRIAVLGRARKSLAPIAEALREAGIPFRAVDLELLGDRPEVLDALALARALLNTQDRIAWLGVLRAPWCGLSLADLHSAAGGDDALLLNRPVPELLIEHLDLLSLAGRAGAERVLAAVAAAQDAKSPLPTANLGTWLEQIWRRIGGSHCYDAAAVANLELLWRCLDGLPAGAADLLGPGLAGALKKLTALPDPATSSDVGVQLMTIHKSKGLEFEMVIVPDLQAKTATGGRKLLSWMERGVGPDEVEDEDAITEFLIAPLPSRGEDAGTAKRWVDRAYRTREEQEVRRLLYVAATRAREELHLFARPACAQDVNGNWSLAEPSTGLLKTAWPAFGAEIQARFEAFLVEKQAEVEVGQIAAAAEDLLAFPEQIPERLPAKSARLRRLPEDFAYPAPAHQTFGSEQSSDVGSTTPGEAPLYVRHEGGLASRVLGTAVHALLEELARLRSVSNWDIARAGLAEFAGRITAQVRGLGFAGDEAAKIASRALDLALEASQEEVGAWILGPHDQAASEVSWTGVVDGAVNTVRVDRVFRAGPVPLADGHQIWWIIDYKTAKSDDISALRPLFLGQLQAYALVLRKLYGANAEVRAGLYYPRAQHLDWWEI